MANNSDASQLTGSLPAPAPERQAWAIALSNWDGKIDQVAWQKAIAEQEAENLDKAPGIPVVFPVND